MTFNEALKILKEHQAWRIGDRDEMHKPADVTKAINIIINECEDPNFRKKSRLTKK